MKIAVIFYHKNIEALYNKMWIQRCKKSMKDQTYADFDVIELNYGTDHKQYFEGVRKNYIFLEHEFENHIGAMNYLYDLLFSNGYDVVFNTNCDDFYSKARIYRQMNAIIKGYQLVSSNFYYVDALGDQTKTMKFDEKNIEKELVFNHNIIAHPVIAMHKSFWDTGLKYEDSIGNEDLKLWKRAVEAGIKIKILPDFLLYYRIHDKQITHQFRE